MRSWTSWQTLRLYHLALIMTMLTRTTRRMHLRPTLLLDPLPHHLGDATWVLLWFSRHPRRTRSRLLSKNPLVGEGMRTMRTNEGNTLDLLKIKEAETDDPVAQLRVLEGFTGDMVIPATILNDRGCARVNICGLCKGNNEQRRIIYYIKRLPK